MGEPGIAGSYLDNLPARILIRTAGLPLSVLFLPREHTRRARVCMFVWLTGGGKGLLTHMYALNFVLIHVITYLDVFCFAGYSAAAL